LALGVRASCGTDQGTVWAVGRREEGGAGARRGQESDGVEEAAGREEGAAQESDARARGREEDRAEEGHREESARAQSAGAQSGCQEDREKDGDEASLGGMPLRTIVIGALACALSVSACSKIVGNDTTVGGAHATGTIHGELRVASQRSPNTLNPLLSGFTTEGFVNRLSFDTLVSVDGSGKNTVPILATVVPTEANGGISKDGLTITYHLHSGVKWHDGVPFSSKDVKFSWQAMMNPANNVNERVGYEEVKSVDTPDANTVVFHLKRKFAPFVDTVFAESDSPVCIVPEHLLGKLHDVNRIPFNQQPIGTGPFKVANWARGDHIEFVANDDYFRGKPKLRRIIVREIPDENTSINALRAHDVDWIFEASPQVYKTLKANPSEGVNLFLNNQPQTLQMLVNTSRPPLDDIRVRILGTRDRERAHDERDREGNRCFVEHLLSPCFWRKTGRANALPLALTGVKDSPAGREFPRLRMSCSRPRGDEIWVRDRRVGKGRGA